MELRVRPYRQQDRSSVRHVCYLTGYMGEPPSWYWRDRDSFADMWSGYYTDAEPDSLFVAETADGVVGYLAGCVDSARAWDPQRVGARHAVRRLCILRPGTAGTIWRALGDSAAGALFRRPLVRSSFSDPRWPSHLHINLLPEARGLGGGRALMGAWWDRLSSTGSPGCHAETLAENTRAVAFFENAGFVRHGLPEPVPGQRSPEGRRLHRQVMVRSIAAGGGGSARQG